MLPCSITCSHHIISKHPLAHFYSSSSDPKRPLRSTVSALKSARAFPPRTVSENTPDPDRLVITQRHRIDFLCPQYFPGAHPGLSLAAIALGDLKSTQTPRASLLSTTFPPAIDATKPLIALCPDALSFDSNPLPTRLVLLSRLESHEPRRVPTLRHVFTTLVRSTANILSCRSAPGR